MGDPFPDQNQASDENNPKEPPPVTGGAPGTATTGPGCVTALIPFGSLIFRNLAEQSEGVSDDGPAVQGAG